MKSNKKQLEERGYLREDLEINSENLSVEEILRMLKSEVSTERTLAARLLYFKDIYSSNRYNIIDELIDALSIEEKLYSKMEICNSLVSYGKFAVKPLIEVLGKIGNNQYKTIPQKKFGKKNYPLPRDIVARTLSRVGQDALPELFKILNTSDISQLSEAIDAIGYICYYNYDKDCYENLIKCYENNIENKLICWKIIRALSGIPESIIFLEDNLKNNSFSILNMEILRSIEQVKKNK